MIFYGAFQAIEHNTVSIQYTTYANKYVYDITVLHTVYNVVTRFLLVIV